MRPSAWELYWSQLLREVAHGCPPARYSVLYILVLIAITLGVFVGHFFPTTGTALKPLGDGFIQLIRMMIAPVIFCTIVHGITSMQDLAKVGRVGLKALLYFEVVSTVALGIGLLVGALAHPGAGFVTLAATLSIVPDIPIQALAVLVGIDKFMSERRALTNLVGNGVTTIVISRWEGELDRDKLNGAMAHPVELGELLEAEPA